MLLPLCVLSALLSFRLGSDRVPKVGIATQLPSGAHSLDNLDYNSYWTFLLNQRDAYESFPAERLDGISCVPAASMRLPTVLVFMPFITAPRLKPEAPSSNTSINSTT